jgi:peroxiredoxin
MMITTLIAAALAVQAPTTAPDVTLLDMAGKPVKLQQFLGKKVILFNWASW